MNTLPNWKGQSQMMSQNIGCRISKVSARERFTIMDGMKLLCGKILLYVTDIIMDNG